MSMKTQLQDPLAPAKFQDPKARVSDSLFIGVYPCGLVYADRLTEVNGDYRRLGFLSYRTLELQLERDCPPMFAGLIRQHAAQMQARRGQQFEVSTCGQTVTLGSP